MVSPLEMVENILKFDTPLKPKRFKRALSLVPESKFSLQLTCPITLKRLKYPVRGKYCRHLETFELNSYVELNYASRRWRCPVCN